MFWAVYICPWQSEIWRCSRLILHFSFLFGSFAANRESLMLCIYGCLNLVTHPTIDDAPNIVSFSYIFLFIVSSRIPARWFSSLFASISRLKRFFLGTKFLSRRINDNWEMVLCQRNSGMTFALRNTCTRNVLQFVRQRCCLVRKRTRIWNAVRDDLESRIHVHQRGARDVIARNDISLSFGIFYVHWRRSHVIRHVNRIELVR